MWQDYVAVTLGMTLRVTGSYSGNQIEMPSWMEMAYPEKKQADTRTPEQIKADILRGLTGA